MHEIQIETQDKWYNLADFDSYEELEDLGEILSVDGLPEHELLELRDLMQAKLEAYAFQKDGCTIEHI